MTETRFIKEYEAAGKKKPKPEVKSDEEVRKVLEEAVSKPAPAEGGTPLLTGEAADAVRENIKKKGVVWKKEPKKKKSD